MLTDAAEQRTSDAQIPCLTETILDVPLDALVSLEIFRNEIRRFIRTDTKLLRQAKRRLPINNSKVDGFGTLALRRRDGIDRETQYRSSGTPVDVFAGGKCFRKPLVAGKVCEDSQFNLRIVGRNKPPAVLGNESTPNLSSEISANRNVL